jgi:hypothetical protein
MGYFRLVEQEDMSDAAMLADKKFDISLVRPMYLMQRRQFNAQDKGKLVGTDRMPYAFLHFYAPYGMWVISQNLNKMPLSICLAAQNTDAKPLSIKQQWFYHGKTAVHGVKLKCKTPHRALHPLPKLMPAASNCQIDQSRLGHHSKDCNKGACKSTFFKCAAGLCKRYKCLCPQFWIGRQCEVSQAHAVAMKVVHKTKAPTPAPTPVKASCIGITECGCILSHGTVFKCGAKARRM